MERYIISICIPTYNGEDVLAETLDSLIAEIKEYPIEIVINDDRSTDNTYQIAQMYSEKYEYISVYQNENNLRMDGNFSATVMKAKGKYVWLCGQDDIFQYNVVEKVIDIIDSHNDLNFMYLNYDFVDDDLALAGLPPRLNINEDQYFETMTDYFKYLDHAPSFLPANLMKKEFWEETKFEEYFGTYYVQTGVWLENLHKGNIYIFAKSDHILCRMPKESWKYKNGNMIFGTALGNLKTYRIAFVNNKIPQSIYLNKETSYLKGFIPCLLAAKAKNMVVTTDIFDSYQYIWGDSKLKLYTIKFLSMLPKWCAVPLYLVAKKIRDVL